jgi:hypothetical protein
MPQPASHARRSPPNETRHLRLVESATSASIQDISATAPHEAETPDSPNEELTILAW